MTAQTPELRPFLALRELANRQAAAVDHDDLPAFTELSRLRDLLMARVLPPGDSATRATAGHLLEEVLATDARVQDLLRDSQAAVRAELRQLGSGRRAMHAYVQPASVEATGGRA
jgi:hypothetical protein